MRSVEDHEGNIFKSLSEMCRYWGVAYNVYLNRIRLGWMVEQALTQTISSSISRMNDDKIKAIKLGYRNVGEMCKAHNVDISNYYEERKCGASVEEALSGAREYKWSKNMKSILGNKNLTSYCKENKLNYRNIANRLSRGYSLSDAIAMERNAYATQEEICPEHGNT